MTALVAIFRRDGQPVQAEELQIIMDGTAKYLAHEGWSDTWVNGSIALGQHFSFVTPEDEYTNGILHEDNLSLLSDARIDNRLELIKQLGLDEENIITDPQLILAVYRKWGKDAPIYLIGDYCFIIWDNNKQELYVAMDHIGARPLIYYITDDLVIFAKDFSVLMEHPLVKIAPNEDYIVSVVKRRSRLKYDYETHYRGMYWMRYAHYGQIGKDNASFTQYWHPDKYKKLNLPNDQAYVDRMLELLELAVRDRLRTKFMAGSHLSGGIDSSSVAVMARRCLQDRQSVFYGYSWSPPAGDNPDRSSEQYRINAIADFADIIPRYLPSLSDTQDNNILEGGVIVNAKKDGVRLMLSGWGGDEFVSFNGRGYRADMFKRGRIDKLLASLDWSKFPRGTRTNLEFIWRDVVAVLTPDFIARHTTVAGKAHRESKKSFMRPEFLEKVKNHSNVIRTDYYQLASVKDTQEYLFNMGHLAHRMDQWNKQGLENGIHYAYPLLDRRIIEFIFQLPDEIFLRAGFKRYFYRYATVSLFPDKLMIDKNYYPKREPGMLRYNKARVFWEQQRGIKKEHEDVDKREEEANIQKDNPWFDYEAWQKSREGVTAEDMMDIPLNEETELLLVNMLLTVWRSIKKYNKASSLEGRPQT